MTIDTSGDLGVMHPWMRYRVDLEDGSVWDDDRRLTLIEVVEMFDTAQQQFAHLWGHALAVDDELPRLRARVETLEGDRQQAVDSARAAQEATARLTHDIQLIARALRDEALRRGWCSEYGDFIDNVNADLQGPERLEHCIVTETRTYMTQVTVTARVGYTDEAWGAVYQQLDNALDHGCDSEGVAEVEAQTTLYRS